MLLIDSMEAAVHHHAHHEMPTSGRALTVVALSATLHCLTGCAIGEILGMVIGTALGFSDLGTIALAVALAFLFGYALTSMPLLRAGFAFAAVVPIALASDTASIAVMEIVDNAIHGGPSPRVVGAIAVVAAVFGTAVLVGELVSSGDDESGGDRPPAHSRAAEPGLPAPPGPATNRAGNWCSVASPPSGAAMVSTVASSVSARVRSRKAQHLDSAATMPSTRSRIAGSRRKRSDTLRSPRSKASSPSRPRARISSPRWGISAGSSVQAMGGVTSGMSLHRGALALRPLALPLGALLLLVLALRLGLGLRV